MTSPTASAHTPGAGACVRRTVRTAGRKIAAASPNKYPARRVSSTLPTKAPHRAQPVEESRASLRLFKRDRKDVRSGRKFVMRLLIETSAPTYRKIPPRRAAPRDRQGRPDGCVLGGGQPRRSRPRARAHRPDEGREQRNECRDDEEGSRSMCSRDSVRCCAVALAAPVTAKMPLASSERARYGRSRCPGN